MIAPERRKPGGNQASVNSSHRHATSKVYQTRYHGVQEVINRLDAKETGTNQYLAKCTAHEDKSPSLSLKLCDDGKLLLHCFAGCEATDVLHAVGLSLTDLYPEPIYHRNTPKPRERKRYGQALAALRALDFELLFIQVCAADVYNGHKLPSSTLKSLFNSIARVRAAREIAA